MSSSDWSFPQPQRPHSSRRHASERKRQGSVWGLILIILLILALLAAGLWWVFLRNDSSDSTLIGESGKSCSGEKNTLSLVVDESVKDVVKAAGEAVHNEGNGCDFFNLVTETSAQTANKLVNGQADQVTADVWLPESSGWLSKAAAGSPKFPTSGRTVARSPLVLVMPNQQLAAQAVNVAYQVRKATDAARGRQTPHPAPTTPEVIAQQSRSWLPYALATSVPAERGGVRFSSPDPASTTAGMLGVLTYPQAFTQGQNTEGIALMQTLNFKTRMLSDTASVEELFNGLKQSTPVVFPVLEQQAWKFANENVGTTMSVVYPADKIAVADYPLVTSQGLDSVKANMAQRLGDKLASSQMNTTWLDHGLRPSTGQEMPRTTTFAPQSLQVEASQKVAIDPTSVSAQIADWVGYKQQQFNVLALVDQSGSMNQPVRVDNRTMTKADLLREAGFEAGELFGTDTALGVWLFGTADDSTAYTEGLSFGPVTQTMPSGKTRREELAALLREFKAGNGVNGDTVQTPLYSSVLDGIKNMQQHVDPRALTIVVPLTDGTDEGSQFSMNTQQYLAKYKEIADPSKPVVVFPIAFGEKADVQALQTIAKASLPPGIPETLNKVSVAQQPIDLAEAIARVFIAVRSPEVAKLRQQQAAAAAAGL